ncbi:MAG: DUF2950 domain-containing protein [bacterium]|nr:DUF2950 domain-containing protein [bacterium]
MISATIHRKAASHVFCSVLALTVAMLVAMGGPTHTHATGGKQTTFTSPESAVQALIQTVREVDKNGLLVILGSEGKDVIESGDEVADRWDMEQFLKAYDAAHALINNSDGSVALQIGTQEWPFPIPLVKRGGAWHFDTPSGVDEILHRRIGRNELSTIQVCLAIVDAQREYAMQDRSGDGFRTYAENFFSDPGKRNGLYWKTQAGEELSPLGILFLKANKEGYTRKSAEDSPAPYHGYYYRLMYAQGKHAPGDAFDYVVRGKMIGGFAVVAYPADYGNSGVMTFIVNHDGIVHQKDLGPGSEQNAGTMQAYDPDGSWVKVK